MDRNVDRNVITVPTITLPEPGDLPYTVYDYWECPSCGNESYYENWDTREYYDIDNLIEHLRGWDETTIQVGGEDVVVTLLKQKVAEYTKYVCDSCDNAYDSDDLTNNTKYECHNCQDSYVGSHDALLCCQGTCPDCTCLNGIRVEKDSGGAFHPLSNDQYEGTNFFWCHCDVEDRDQACGYLVCVVCHTVTSNTRAVYYHSCAGSPKETKGVVMEVVGLYLDSQTDCMCELGFCCQVHDKHRVPHVLCEQEN